MRTAVLGALAGLVFVTCAPAVSTDPTELGSAEQGGLSSRSVTISDGDATAISTSGRVTPPSLPSDGDESGEGEARDGAAAFGQVAVHTPKVRADDVPLDRDVVNEILGIEGVAFATSMVVGTVEVEAAEGASAVKVAAVDPAGFRVLAPQVTADAVEVWQRISEGDAAFVHDVGHRLQLELGQRLPAAGDGTLRVGALASNGAPPVADALVSRETAQNLGLEGTRSVLISVTGDQSASDVAERIRTAIGLSVQVLEEPTTQRAFLSGSAARNAFQPFNYVSFGDGMVQIDSGWVRNNIVRARVPVLRGEVMCHRLLISQLRGALQEIQDRGLAHLIDPTQYGGCWVPRHIMFDANRGLSMHAWGLAVDLNVSSNLYGETPQMDPRVVEVFDRWGFVWGGRWSTPDGMHFELGALLQNPG